MDIPHPVYAVDIPETTKNQTDEDASEQENADTAEKEKKEDKKKDEDKKEEQKSTAKGSFDVQMERITEQEPDLREKSKLRLP